MKESPIEEKLTDQGLGVTVILEKKSTSAKVSFCACLTPTPFNYVRRKTKFKINKSLHVITK